jgi:F0F1-type ATP synthase membrane subunit b/b'
MEDKMVDEIETRKIMTKPLPQILDEIEDSIKLANEAAKNARQAAEEARKAGEKAASEAARVAAERIAKVEQKADKAMQLAELLKLAIVEAATTTEKRLSGKA